MKIENLSELNSKKHKKQAEKDLSFFFGSDYDKEKNIDETVIFENEQETKKETKHEDAVQTDQAESFFQKDEEKIDEFLNSIDLSIQAQKETIALDDTIVQSNIQISEPEQIGIEAQNDLKIKQETNNNVNSSITTVETSSRRPNKKNEAGSENVKQQEQVYVLNEKQIENIILNAINKKEIIDQQKSDVSIKKEKKSKPVKKKNTKSVIVTIVLVCMVISIAALTYIYKDKLLNNPFINDENKITDTEPPTFNLHQNEITIERSKLIEFDCSKYIDKNSFADNVDKFGDLAIMYSCPDVSKIGENVNQFAITYKLIDRAGNEAKKDLIVNVQD